MKNMANFAVEELEPRMEMQMLGLGVDPRIIEETWYSDGSYELYIEYGYIEFSDGSYIEWL